jgi:hypothetical protein
MFLYFGGCSYTEGQGLADYAMFPNDYPGDYATLEDALKSGWVDARQKLLGHDKIIRYKLIEENNNRAYPAHLGKIINARVLNHGVAGNSMFGIMVRTIHGLNELVKANDVPDQVFIGLTTIERIPVLNIETDPEDRRWTFTLTPSHIKAGDKFEKYAREYWMVHTDEQLLTTYLYHCLSIKNYVKLVTGKDPIFLDTASFRNNYYEIVKNTRMPQLKEVSELLDLDNIFNHTSLGSFARNDVRFVADGHWTEHAHVQFANHLAETFFKLE